MPEYSIESWVTRLTDAARCGHVLDLAPGVPDDDLDPGTSAQWPHERTLPADAIRRTLLNRNLNPDPRGLRLRGARVVNPLDLSFATLPCPLRLERCALVQDADFQSASLVVLSLNGSHVQAVSLAGATVESDVEAIGLTAYGAVSAVGAQIDGQLILTGANLTTVGGNALTLDGARITGGLFASQVATHGEVRAIGAQIDGQLDLTGAALTNEGGNALTLDAAGISMGLVASGLTAHGPVRAVGAKIGGQLNLTEANLTRATLTREGGKALSLDGASITGDALTLDGASLTGGLLASGLTTHGQVRALGAQISGQLDLTGADLTNEGGVALGLDRASVTGDLSSSLLTAHGEVRAVGAQIGGTVDLMRADLTNEGGVALGLDGASINGTLVASDVDAHGPVRAVGVHISGQLNLTGATLTNEGGDALTLEAASVGTLYLRQPGAWGGDLVLNGCTLKLLVVDDTPFQSGLPGPLFAAGWSVGDVHGFLRHNRKAAAAWLDTNPTNGGFVPQPWHELANVYDRNGQPADARRLRFSAAWRTTKHAPWPTKIIRSIYGLIVGYGYYPLTAVVPLVLTAVVAFALTAASPDAFTPTSPTAARPTQTQITPATGTPCPTDTQPLTGATDPACLAPGYPPLNPELYALTTVTPASAIANPAWAPTPACLAVILQLLKFTGWIFTAFLLAGLTGLLRKV